MTTTINIGGLKAYVDVSGDSLSGNLELIDYDVGGVSLVRISAVDDVNKGASIYRSLNSINAHIEGEISLLDGKYDNSIIVDANEQGFDVLFPKQEFGIADLQPRVTLYKNDLKIVNTISFEENFQFLGLAPKPEFEYVETITININDRTLTRSYVASAGIYGVTVKTPRVTLTMSDNPADDAKIVARTVAALASKIEDVIRDYLFGKKLLELGSTVANYVSDYGNMIVDAIGSLFGGSSSDSPPPPYFINPHRDYVKSGSHLIQWGQAVSTIDAAEYYPLAEPLASPVSAVLVNTARPNIRSSLSVGVHKSDSFAIDRHNDIGYHIPFHWIGIGSLTGGAPSKGMIDIGNARIAWGREISTTDGDQVISMAGKFGSGTFSVITTPAIGGQRHGFSVQATDPLNGKFTVDHDGDINGQIPFNYIAIGAAPNKTVSGNFIDIGGAKLQWGKATSTSDGEQLYTLPSSFKTMQFSVVTTVALANVKSALSLSRPINESGFILNRDGVLDGSISFHWIAVGR